MFMIKLEYVFA